MSSTDETTARFDVVANEAGQHALWPVGRPLPGGWRAVGFTGTREACLSHVEAVWTDMRPVRLRQALAERTAASDPLPRG